MVCGAAGRRMAAAPKDDFQFAMASLLLRGGSRWHQFCGIFVGAVRIEDWDRAALGVRAIGGVTGEGGKGGGTRRGGGQAGWLERLKGNATREGWWLRIVIGGIILALPGGGIRQGQWPGSGRHRGVTAARVAARFFGQLAGCSGARFGIAMILVCTYPFVNGIRKPIFSCGINGFLRGEGELAGGLCPRMLSRVPVNALKAWQLGKTAAVGSRGKVNTREGVSISFRVV